MACFYTEAVLSLIQATFHNNKPDQTYVEAEIIYTTPHHGLELVVATDRQKEKMERLCSTHHIVVRKPPCASMPALSARFWTLGGRRALTDTPVRSLKRSPPPSYPIRARQAVGLASPQPPTGCPERWSHGKHGPLVFTLQKTTSET